MHGAGGGCRLLRGRTSTVHDDGLAPLAVDCLASVPTQSADLVIASAEASMAEDSLSS